MVNERAALRDLIVGPVYDQGHDFINRIKGKCPAFRKPMPLLNTAVTAGGDGVPGDEYSVAMRVSCASAIPVTILPAPVRVA
jgi:hypothetical protein